MRRCKVLATIAVLLWYTLLGVGFIVVRPELAYSYGHWLDGLQGHLPQLTASLSLPLLGPTLTGPVQAYGAPFWLGWGLLLTLPALSLLHLRSVSDAPGLIEWLLWAVLYLLGASLLAGLVAFGLWLPFSAA